ALEVQADQPDARQGLKEAYRAAGRHDAYLETLEAELAGAPDPERIVELATAWEEHGRLDRALASWQRLVDADPSHAGGQKRLARALERAARWPELVAAHRAHLNVVSGDERIAVLVELAAVLESRVGDVDGAIAALGEALELSPGHRGAAF